jgi:hypothetical protein
MHLWECHPAQGHQVSQAVRTLMACGVRLPHLEDGSWTALCGGQIEPKLVDIIMREIRVMARITAELQLQLLT